MCVCVFTVFEHVQYIAVRILSVYTCECVCACVPGRILRRVQYTGAG